MSFNSFFGFKENFENPDKAFYGADKGDVDFNGVVITPSDNESQTDFTLNEALYVKYEESNKEECNNIR